jgi:16S rRNA (guanine966-N2)-methyltransferase
LRVISGKYGGQNLVGFKNQHIRPTTDREKETIFNILQNEIFESRVLDLFSGTGSLGIEAISRGAKRVSFVDFHQESLKIIKENLKKLKVVEETEIIKSDVLKFLKNYSGSTFEVILIDPPFTKSIAHEVMCELQNSQVLANQTIVCIECGKTEKLESTYGFLECKSVKNFKDKHLYIFRVEKNEK